MTTFHGRLLISSLPDLRGIWGLSYDEGSVISTVASASQLILAPILPFFLTALGLRRLLLPLSLGFVCVAFCIPFISGYENLLVCDGAAVPANVGVNPSLTITARPLLQRARSCTPS